jgi:hypothetical protein
MDEARRFIQILGRQFMFESDSDSRELSGTIYQKPMNAAQAYASMKRS